MNDNDTTIGELRERVAGFISERDWEQFHDPKNLAMSIAIEAAELMEIFQWVTPEESRNITNNPEKYSQPREELADVLIYALRLADFASIDAADAIEEKLKINAEKYPPGGGRHWSI